MAIAGLLLGYVMAGLLAMAIVLPAITSSSRASTANQVTCEAELDTVETVLLAFAASEGRHAEDVYELGSYGYLREDDLVGKYTFQGGWVEQVRCPS